MQTAPDTLTVLYVEDDALTRQSVSNRLARQGVHVLAAASGEEALQLVASLPNLGAALLDVQLPGIDGLETYLRLREAYPHLAVVFCSAHLDAPTKDRLTAWGIPHDRLLQKPCPFSRVLAALESAAHSNSNADE